MTSGAHDASTARTRREPPPFRRVEVREIIDRSPRLRRVILSGPELAGFELDLPAASVRLLLPPSGSSSIVMPTWTGNQFELPTGDRAPIRTFTPRHHDAKRDELTLDFVLHESGAASDWARHADAGDVVAISGPGRGYEIDIHASTYLLVGDETAIPAIDQLLEAIPTTTAVDVHIEVADPAARLELHDHPSATVQWHELPDGSEPGAAMFSAVESIERLPEAIWIAGEAAAVQRLRKHLFDGRGVPRPAATIRGYWKLGRSAT